MSSSRAAGGFSARLRRAAGAMTLALPVLLAGCTGFTPVYNSTGISSEKLDIAYADPTNRTEQIIYQDLALRLGKGGADAPKLTVSTTQSSHDLTNNTITAATSQKQLVVYATVTLVSAEGKTLFSGSRRASADYTTNAQILANNQAERDAGERAAHLLADTIRLTVLGALHK
jgi:hypothetical protein